MAKIAVKLINRLLRDFTLNRQTSDVGPVHMDVEDPRLMGYHQTDCYGILSS